MRIGFDAKRAAQNRTGLGNYSRYTIDILINHTPTNEYLLYAPDKQKAKLLGNLPKRASVCFPTGIWNIFSSLWRIWGIIRNVRKDNLTIFHGLSNELPLNITQAKHCKSIVTIHDLIFLRYPSYYHYIDRKIYTYKFRKACQNANRIIAISECTKKDIIHFFDIPEKKIEVVYQGCDKQFRKPVTDEIKKCVKQKYQLPEQYLLYVGSIEERKNLLLIAKALKHIRQPISLIAIGKRTPYTGKVEAFLKSNQLESQVRFFSNIPFAELPAFYQMATTFVYPSFFEGFGIPMLEALNCGVPAIGAKGSCLEEAGGPHSLYVDPTNEKELAEAIEKTLTDQTFRQTMITKGKEYATQFEECKLAADLLSVYNKTVNE